MAVAFLRLLGACLVLHAMATAASAQPATTLDQFIGCSLYSDEQPPKFLGVISRSTFGDSIRNTFGSYGSAYSSTSIRNSYSNYGSLYSSLSAYNTFATRPPLIVNSSLIIVGFLTKNRTINGGLDPDFLLIGLDVLDNWSYHSQFFTTASFEHLIEASDGTRLGFTYPDTANSLSVINESGQYGSATSSTSIYNPFSPYGSSSSPRSAYNSAASAPPIIYRRNKATGLVSALAYVTKNTAKTPYEDPDELKVALLLAALPATTPQPTPNPTPTPTPSASPTPTPFPTPPPGQPWVAIQTVLVGDAGNAAHSTGYGSVPHEFRIGKYEVTLGQYAAFLNAVAATNTNSYVVDLWAPFMNHPDGQQSGIERTGSGTTLEPYFYNAVGPFGFAPAGANNPSNRPFVHASWFAAARFCNWLHNGATSGADTETGAYVLNGATNGVILRTSGAKWWIPSEDEWVKAAYYKAGGTNAGYWTYPTQSDAKPGNTIGDLQNQANYDTGSYPTNRFAVTQSSSVVSGQNYLTDVGAFAGSASAYGTLDQGGNTWEWNDAVINGMARGVRGGNWIDGVYGLRITDRDLSLPVNRSGFRVATLPVESPTPTPTPTPIPTPTPKQTQNITFTQLAAQVYEDGRTLPLSANNASGRTVTFISSSPNMLSVSGNSATIHAAGSVTITATNEGDESFLPGGASQIVTIAKATQSIPAWTFLTNPPVGGLVTFSNTNTTMGLPVSYSLVSGPAAVTNGNQLLITGVGRVTVVASQQGDSNHNPAAPITNSFTTVRANQTLSPFAPSTNVPFGAVVTFSNTRSSADLPVLFQVVSGPATISGNTARITGVGPVSIRASAAASANHNAAVITNAFTAVKANQAITFNALSNQVFAPNKTFTLSATSSAGLPVTFTSSNTNVVTILGNVATLRGGGTATIRATRAGNATFNAATLVDQTLVVTPGNQTITFTQPPAQVFAPNKTFTLSATASSRLPVSFESANSNVVSIVGNLATIRGAGSVEITARRAGNASYAAAPEIRRTVVVSKANQTIGAFAPVGTRVFGAAPFAVTVPRASSGLPVTLRVVSGPALVSGNTVTLTGAGPVVLAANQAGNENFNAAREVTTSFVVNKQNVVAADIVLSNTIHTFDGTAKGVAVATVPPGLATRVTYNGSTNLPVKSGTYNVAVTINEPNYQGSRGGIKMTVR